MELNNGYNVNSWNIYMVHIVACQFFNFFINFLLKIGFF